MVTPWHTLNSSKSYYSTLNKKCILRLYHNFYIVYDTFHVNLLSHLFLTRSLMVLSCTRILQLQIHKLNGWEYPLQKYSDTAANYVIYVPAHFLDLRVTIRPLVNHLMFTVNYYQCPLHNSKKCNLWYNIQENDS